MGWVVAFAGQKGGAGKTTAATGFAVSAAQHGARVQLGDMDSGQQSAMSWGERRKANGHEPAIDVQVIVVAEGKRAVLDKVKSWILSRRTG